MIENIHRIRDEARTKISAAPDPQELDKLRVHYLGKKGILTDLLHGLKALDPEKRREFGALLNEVKTDFESEFDRRQSELRRLEVEKELARSAPIDLTLPGRYAAPVGSLHPVSRVMDQLVQCLKRVGFSIASGPEVETEWFNFEALNMPADHPARDMQDTFYLTNGNPLRTHTSPVQIRAMKAQQPPIQIMAFGRVYRSDYDATHTPMFHQLEGLMVDKHISFADLKGVLFYVVKSLFGARPLRFRPSYFPFTEPSAEVDMQFGSGKDTKWLEIGGCGMVHPNVLKAAGYDPEEVTGFAFGLGIERIAMLKYGMDDLRALFENDIRMLEQF